VNSTATPPEPVQPSGLGPSLKVLVVDDDGSNRLLAVRWLERVGIATCEAENGEDALRMLRRAPESIGAVILDLMMPTMSGYELLEQVRADDTLRDVPVVILTSFVQEESDVVSGLKSGAVDHLSKPFRGPILAAKVQSLLERRSRQLSLQERLRRAEAHVTTDQLTGFGNRRQFDLELQRELSFTRRHRLPLALVLIDIDNLHVINSAFGRSSGDRAISWTAEGLRRAMRASDSGFRIGGDELAVLLRGLDYGGGLGAAARFAKSQAAQPLHFEDGEPLKVTVSFGVASADGSNDFDVGDLFERADRALYLAKTHPEEPAQGELC
jgi:two-component system, cell cycle response regulator